MSVIFTQPLFPHKGQGSARILFASKIQKDPAPSGRWSGQEPQEPKVNGSKAAIAEVSWFCPNIAVFLLKENPKKIGKVGNLENIWKYVANMTYTILETRFYLVGDW